VRATVDFNVRRRMAEFAKRVGSCPELVTAEELRRQRRRG